MPPNEEWVRKAEEDLAVAHLAVGNALWSPACFHAQQASEKALKAVYEAAALPVPRIHDLDALLQGLEDKASLDVTPVREAALVLTSYGVDARYPGFEADATEASEAVRLAETMMAWSAKQMPIP